MNIVVSIYYFGYCVIIIMFNYFVVIFYLDIVIIMSLVMVFNLIFFGLLIYISIELKYNFFKIIWMNNFFSGMYCIFKSMGWIFQYFILVGIMVNKFIVGVLVLDIIIYYFENFMNDVFI